MDEVDDAIEQTLDTLNLRILQEERDILDPLGLIPILTVVSRTVNNTPNAIFLQHIIILSHLLPTHIQPLQNLRTILLKILHFEFVPRRIPHIRLDNSIFELLLDILELGWLEGLYGEIQDWCFYSVGEDEVVGGDDGGGDGGGGCGGGGWGGLAGDGDGLF